MHMYHKTSSMFEYKNKIKKYTVHLTSKQNQNILIMNSVFTKYNKMIFNNLSFIT